MAPNVKSTKKGAAAPAPAPPTKVKSTKSKAKASTDVASTTAATVSTVAANLVESVGKGLDVAGQLLVDGSDTGSRGKTPVGIEEALEVSGVPVKKGKKEGKKAVSAAKEEIVKSAGKGKKAVDGAVKEGVDKAGKAVSEAEGKIVKKTGSTIDRAAAATATAGSKKRKTADDFMSTAQETVTAAVADIAERVGTVVGGVVDSFASASGLGADLESAGVEPVKKKAKQVAGEVGKKGKKAVQAVEEVAEQAETKVEDGKEQVAKKGKKGVKQVEEAVEKAGKKGKQVKEAVVEIEQVAEKKGKKAKADVESTGEGAKKKGKAVVKDVEEKVEKGKKAVKGATETATTEAKVGKSKKGRSVVDDAADTIATAVEPVITKGKRTAAAAVDETFKKGKKTGKIAQAAATAAVEAVQDAASDIEMDGDSDDDDEGSVVHGFSSSDGGADSSDDESDEEDAAVKAAGKRIDMKSLPMVAKDDETVQARLRKALKKKDSQKGTLYLGRIPHGFYEDQMKEYFTQFGDVSRLRLARNRKTGASKHYAYIEMQSQSVAEIVADTMNNYLLMGHLLKCHVIPADEVHPQLWVGANKKFRVIPKARLEKSKHDKIRTQEQQDRANTSILQKQDARRKKIKDRGIDYDFDGHA